VNEKIEDSYFDFSMKVLNYAIEFVNQPGYSSLRMTDVLENLALLAPKLENVNKSEFYNAVIEKFKNKPVMSTSQERSVFLNDLLEMFINEWRMKKS
jgi:hypothetical protein